MWEEEKGGGGFSSCSPARIGLFDKFHSDWLFFLSLLSICWDRGVSTTKGPLTLPFPIHPYAGKQPFTGCGSKKSILANTYFNFPGCVVGSYYGAFFARGGLDGWICMAYVAALFVPFADRSVLGKWIFFVLMWAVGKAR